MKRMARFSNIQSLSISLDTADESPLSVRRHMLSDLGGNSTVTFTAIGCFELRRPLAPRVGFEHYTIAKAWQVAREKLFDFDKLGTKNPQGSHITSRDHHIASMTEVAVAIYTMRPQEPGYIVTQEEADFALHQVNMFHDLNPEYVKCDNGSVEFRTWYMWRFYDTLCRSRLVENKVRIRETLA